MKTLDFRAPFDHDQAVKRVRPRQGGTGASRVRLEAETAADAGSPASALALLTAAAEDAERHAPDDAATLLGDASWHALQAYGPARALEVARRAVSLAAGADGDVAIHVRARLGDALQWNGLSLEAQREWLIAADAPASSDPHVRCVQAAATLRAGRLAEARERAYAAAARAREAADEFLLRDALTFQVISEIHLGLLREARASSRLVEEAAGVAMTGERLEALGLAAWVDALLGDVDACLVRFAAVDELADALGITPSLGMAAGLLALSRSRYEEAVHHLETKLAGGSPLAAIVSLRPFLDALVEACVLSGRGDRAHALVDDAFDAAVATAQPRFTATAYRIRALDTGDLGDFERALEKHRFWGNRFEEARTRLVYGETLRRARRRTEAQEQLAAAALAFAAAGSSMWEQRAKDELRAVGTRVARLPSGTPLTPQEDRVARLVADGLTNKEIAARLVVSTKTVEGHLRNIFEKLGLTSRTQLARAMAR